jgi:alanine racemase
MRKLVIDLNAVAANLNAMRALHGTTKKVMGVVKANAYGHGMIAVSHRLEAEGIDYLGVADVAEALAIRAAGITTPVLAWLHDPADDFAAAVRAQIDLGVSNLEQLRRVADAAAKIGSPARVHLKVDTGLGRNGATLADWPALVHQTLAEIEAGRVRAVGCFSHLSSTSEGEDRKQIERFNRALEEATAAGLEFELRHLTASDGSLSYQDAHFDMIRVGIALYGLSPFSDNRAAEFALTPAMCAESTVVQTKRVNAGEGVSYGYLHRTAAETTLALIPVGYAEGLPRNATGNAQVCINGKLYKILSRVAMDQFVIDVGDDAVVPGDRVVIFGDCGPTADDFASACDTINYEIVTRIGGRFERVYVGETKGQLN